MNMLHTMKMAAHIVMQDPPAEVSIPQFAKMFNVLSAVAIGVGGLWLFMEIIYFGVSLSTSDQSQKTHSLLRMAGAFIVLSAGSIYQVLK